MSAPVTAVAIPDEAHYFRAFLDQHPEPTFGLTVDGALTSANRAFARFTGRDAATLTRVPLAALLTDDARPRLAEAWPRVLEGRAQAFSGAFHGPAGSVSLGAVTLAPVVVDDVVVGVQGIARDVTVFRVIEEQLHARILTDPLTGLANRAQLTEAIERAMRRTGLLQQHAGSIAILFLDLDNFKLINDGLGHAAGDALLAAVAERLRSATRGHDLVARLGGDEFAVLLTALHGPESAHVVAERILSALATPVTLDGRSLATAGSVGLAYWDGAATAAELLRNADLAMYRAKSRGKGCFAVFDATMQREARERLELASDLRDAVRGGLLGAAFQPVVELATGRIVKCEVLARWTHPQRGVIAPSVFVPLAEEMGLIDDLGACMLRHAVAALRGWTAGPLAEVSVTVNVSGVQLESGTFVADVRALLHETGVAPHRLVLELTESAAMQDPAAVQHLLQALSADGVHWAIDDFGTGYSSLSHLHRLPVQLLKIDKSFVEGLRAERADAHADAIVRTILAVARSLGLRVVAEGIETAAQAELLRALGCDLGQGYFFARPLPLRAFAELVAAQR